MECMTWMVPIIPGKVEQWKQFCAAMEGPRRAERDASRRRMGLTREVASLQQLPDGSYVGCIFGEAEDIDTVMRAMATSTDPFDVWFRDQALQIHGMTPEMFAGPPPAQTLLDYNASATVPTQRTAGQTLAAGELADFGQPTEVRQFPHGRMEILSMRQGTVGHAVLEPGWRWSNDVKPIAGTEWCEAPHFQYQLSGRMHVVMKDGKEFDTHAGQISALPVGHDAWVVGDEPVEVVDWAGATHYAVPTPATTAASKA